jgi:hypothetical protein
MESLLLDTSFMWSVGRSLGFRLDAASDGIVCLRLCVGG